MEKVILTPEQQEQAVKALLEAGEVKLGTSNTSFITLKTTYYEVELNNPDGKPTKKKAMKLRFDDKGRSRRLPHNSYYIFSLSVS